MQKCFVFHILASKHIINKGKFNINVQRNKPLCLTRIFKKIENWMSCMVFIDLYWSMQSRGLFYTITYKPYNTWGHYHVDKKKTRFKCFYVTRATNI